MARSLVVLGLVLSLAAVVFATSTKDATATKDVCVLGAGPAGLHMAAKLEEKGYSVVVLEKQDRVGGRVVTTKVPALNSTGMVPLDMGAVILGNQTDRLSTAYALKFNVTLKPLLEEMALVVADDVMEGNGGLPMNLEDTHPRQRMMMEYAMEQYLQERSLVPDLDDEAGMGNMSEKLIKFAEEQDRSLLGTFRQYLVKHHPSTWRMLESMFAGPLTTFGYGAMDEIGAIYALKYLYPTYMRGMLSALAPKGSQARAAYVKKYPCQWHYVEESYEEVFVRLAKTLKDVRLNAQVREVLRPAAGAESTGTVTLKYTTGAEETTLKCGKVVLAFPPPTKRLGFMDLDSTERALYDQVLLEPYYSAAVPVELKKPEMRFYMDKVDMPLPNGMSLRLPLPPPLDARVHIAMKWSRSRFAQVAMLDHLTAETKSTEELRASIANRFGQTAADGAVSFITHDYFPHVKPSTQTTFYKDFRAIQGRRNTFYAGTLWSFDDVEFALRAADNMAKVFF